MATCSKSEMLRQGNCADHSAQSENVAQPCCRSQQRAAKSDRRKVVGHGST